MRSQRSGEPLKYRETELNKEDVEEDEDEGYGVRKTVKKLDPREPSKEEREKSTRRLTCLFEIGAGQCVRGRGKEEACREAKTNHEVAEVHLDFMFMGDEGEDRTLAVLVAKKRSRGMVATKVVEEIGRLRAAIGGQGMVVENSPVYSSKSNGIHREDDPERAGAGEDVEE